MKKAKNNEVASNKVNTTKGAKKVKTATALNEVVADPTLANEAMEKLKADTKQLFRAVANKKLGVDQYDPKLITPEVRAEIAAMTTVAKLQFLGFTVAAGDTKPAKVAKVKAEPKEKVVIPTTDISAVEVGAVIRYGTSKKPYIVTEKNEKGRMLVSVTQKFFSSKPSFPVVQVEAGTGKLPVSFKDEALNALLEVAKTDLADRQAKIAAAEAKANDAAEKKAAKAVKAESKLEVVK